MSTLSYREIMSIPSGRIMNTFIQEYVFHEYPTRWSNGEQKEIPAHWFDEHPRACAEDDGGYCTADGLTRYSTDPTAAMSITVAASMRQRSLVTRTDPVESLFPAMEKRYWATFATTTWEQDQKYAECNRKWANAETLEMAICRAALLVV